MSFEGSIGEIDLIQRLVELGREHFTGAIRFEEDGTIKIIYFKGGDVLSASTNDRKDAIDEILLRAGKVSREHVKQALAKRQESETLGDALLNLGFITRKELTWARRIQVIGIIRSVRGWTNGTYAIVADYLPKREEGTLFPLPQIIVEFTVTEQDRAAFDRAMDGGNAVFRKTDAFDAAFPILDLNDDAAAIVGEIDGDKSAAEIAGATGADAFNVYKLLEALRILGLIEKSDASHPEALAIPALTGAEDDLSFESAGVADAADAWSPAPPPPEEPAPPAEPPMRFEQEAARVPFALQLEPGQMAPPPPPSSEKQWGFDEAQIEAAQRGALPHPPMIPKKRAPIGKPVPKRKGSGGLVFALILVLLLGGIAFGGWMWWQGRVGSPAPVARTPEKHPVITPATTAAVAPPPTETTSSVAPPPASVPPPHTTPAATSTARAATSGPAESRLEQSAGGGKTITNVAAPAAAESHRGDKYAAMAREYARNATGNYTIQFELVCQTPSLTKAIEAGGSNVWFVPTTYRGQECYRVFWGHYDTRDSAIAAVDRIPSALHGSTPVVVSVPK